MPEKIRLPAYLKQALYKRNLQINSLKKLPTPILGKVLEKKLPVLAFHDGQPYKAFVEDSHQEDFKSFWIHFWETPEHLTPGENLVLVIATPKERFVLQGLIKEKKASQVLFSTVDPRTEERLVYPKPEPVFLSFLPLPLFEGLLSERYFLLRDTNIPKEGAPELKKAYVYDLIIDQQENVAEEFSRILKNPGQVGFLKDISRGGAGVSCPKEPAVKESQPLYLRGTLQLPSGVNFNLGLIGLLRGRHKKEGQTFLHIMWARPLPSEVYLFLKEHVS